MEKIITTIVTQLLSKLSKDRKYYTQKNLSDYGFPQFLIKRITFHLVSELNKEFTLPGEVWLNRESDELLAEWTELQRTIKREIHLPAYLAEEMIKKSVKECVGMTIQPRKVIPELLFEDYNEMDSNQLTERSSAITVNRFLVWSMIRYMEKKNRESLKITDAARILESIESKIVENYHPLNWLSLVKPLYELSGNTVHSDLFRRFFEHKGKNHIAKEFDLIDDEIKESRFIEVLSSPNSIHVEGYKDDQQTLFQEEDKGGVVEADEPMEDLIEKQDEQIEDLTEDTPIFQSFREEHGDESDVWEGDNEEELDLESEDEEDIEEELDLDSEDDEDIEEEQVLESKEKAEKEDAKNIAKEGESELIEDVEEEQKSESKENVEEEDEQIEDLTDDTPIFQSFREEPVDESDELEEDIEEELVLESDEDDDIEEELVLESDEDEDIEEELAIESEEDKEEEVVNLAKEDESELIDDVEEEQKSEPEVDHTKANIQDEELKAPWEDEEEEDLYTFIRHDDEVEDTLDSELNDLYEEEQEGEEDEGQEEVIEDESVISKKEEPVSDAALLEIEDEENEEADSEDDEDDEENSSLLNRFMFDDTDSEDTLGDIGADGDKKVTTIYDELNLVRNDVKPETMDLFGTLDTPEIENKPFVLKPDDKKQDSETDESDRIRKFSELEDSDSEEDSSDTEVPMWRSFLERDENEAKSAFQFDNESEADDDEIDFEDSAEKLDEDGFIEEPIYDFTKREVDLDEKIGDLSNWMNDVREKFIEDLFGDSEDAYEQALSDIMEFDDWKNASKYIEKEIFTRNRIDVYDEIAVDFTDRLHSYFIENKS